MTAPVTSPVTTASPAPDTATPLATLVGLSRRAREAAERAELGFIAVNETRQLLDYRQAALWLPEQRGDARLVLSGVARPESDAPYGQWLRRLFDLAPAGPVSAAAVTAAVAEDWARWLPAQALALPLVRGERTLGCLLLARDAPWQESEIALAEELAHAYAHALALLSPRPAPWRGGRRWVWRLGLAAALAALGLVPVPLTTLAPAEVAARAPFLVRAPIEGVIDRFEARPNQAVAAGQLLFEFDSTALRNKKLQAGSALAVAAEEFRQAAQLAVTSDKGRLDMSVRRGEMASHAAELRYSEQLLERGRVRSPRAGVAIFGDPSDWIGRVVRVGEKVLEIADPEAVELLIHLPMADAIPLQTGARVDLFLAVAPEKAWPAVLEYASYRAEPQADGAMAYRLKARFSGDKPPRIGLAGTARLHGERVSLAYYVFRRPLAALRLWLGW